MQIKTLIGILNRPWLMEPTQAAHWASVAKTFLAAGAIDNRELHTYSNLDVCFRLNADGTLNNTAGPIQVIKIHGPITKYNYCGSPGSMAFADLVKAADADPTVTCILLDIDSPGGQASGTEALATAIHNCTTPVVAYGDTLCSAAYWIGSASRHIVASHANNGYDATIGSIGTMVMYCDDSKQREMEGVKDIFIFADESPDKWAEYFQVMKGDYTAIKKTLNGLNATFTAAVKNYRGTKLSNSENVLSGKVYNATEALTHGLVDSLGTFDDAVALAATFFKPTISYTPKNTKMNSPFAQVLNTISAADLPVVDGGFLVTEEQLVTLNSHIANSRATTENLNSLLAAQKEFVAQADTTKQALSQAQAANNDLQKRIAQLETEGGSPIVRTSGDQPDQEPTESQKTNPLDVLLTQMIQS